MLRSGKTNQASVPAGKHDRRSCIGVLAVFATERQGEFLPGAFELRAADVLQGMRSTSSAFEFGGDGERLIGDNYFSFRRHRYI